MKDVLKTYQFKNVVGYFYVEILEKKPLCCGCYFNSLKLNCPEEANHGLLCLSIQRRLKASNIVFKKIRKEMFLKDEKEL